MSMSTSDLTEKIRQQFDFGPYPRIPIDQTPKDNANALFIHNLVTPYYRKYRKIVDPSNKVILDAGCGTGYKSLTLALANPGAKIVGIDISPESIKLARQRLRHHGIEQAEFHVLPLEEVSSLGMEFDYINCDEVLYLLPDLTVGLRAFQSVLKPEGIIRSNLHSAMQREVYFRAQKMFQLMGLLDQNPTELELEIVVETMQSLKDAVYLKLTTWNPRFEDEGKEEGILMNHLFQGDKGYTIPDLFAALRESDLEFVSMVNWRHWDLTDLFKDPEDLPVFWAMSLPDVPLETRLHLYELLNPVHRLIDFWCAHNADQTPLALDIDQWELSDWQQAQVSLHPQLRTAKFKQDLIDCVTNHKAFDFTQHLSNPALAPVFVSGTVAACILKLWEGKQPVLSLVEHWLQISPVNPITLEPLTRTEALAEIIQVLNRLEAFLYLLPELPSQV
jgi:2-polyprenyl-3-methyl-5-hydroxy-6-metoxy-1,4-benzoquinol methylase